MLKRFFHQQAKVRLAAPTFSCPAVVNNEIKTVRLSDYNGKWVILFFYPLNFTFVCPTEIIAMSERVEEFKKRNCQVLGISVDSQYSHLAWINTPRKEGGLGKMKIPLLSDLTKSISKDYGVMLPDESHTFRGTYMIDPKGIIRHLSVNDTQVGRSVDETLRLLEAFQHSDQYGEVCPINWKKGSKTMIGDPDKSKEYFRSVNKD